MMRRIAEDVGQVEAKWHWIEIKRACALGGKGRGGRQTSNRSWLVRFCSVNRGIGERQGSSG